MGINKIVDTTPMIKKMVDDTIKGIVSEMMEELKPTVIEQTIEISNDVLYRIPHNNRSAKLIDEIYENVYKDVYKEYRNNLIQQLIEPSKYEEIWNDMKVKHTFKPIGY